ncbi:hypothetical protein HispidOSU_017282 [Sigmodon hispidus]
MTPGDLSWGKGETEQGSRESSFHNLGVTTPVQDPTTPLRRTLPAASASLPPSGFLLSSGPTSGRAPGRNPLHAERPRGPRARPPAGAKVSCPQRKDARPGLPGSSRAYLRDGLGLGPKENAARARGLRDNSVQDLEPPPLRRHQPKRRRKRSQNTRTPRHQRKSAPAIVQGTAAECRNIAQLLLQVRPSS